MIYRAGVTVTENCLTRFAEFYYSLIQYLFKNNWGRGMHICVGDLTIIGSDNGSLPGRRQAIIQTDARILLIGPREQTSVKF